MIEHKKICTETNKLYEMIQETRKDVQDFTAELKETK